MTANKRLTVDELLTLAREAADRPFTNPYTAGPLARAVIELLSAPDPGHLAFHRIGTKAEITVCCYYVKPTEARGLAVALLKAADEAERSGDA